MERRQLATLIQAASPQVLHAHWTYEFAAAALATNLPTLVTAHDSPRVLRDNFGGYYWRQRAALGDRVLGNVQRLSAVSPELLEDLLASCPSLEDKSIVIPNGTATMNIGRPGGDFGGSFVSIANGFDERKNTRTLIEAFSMLKKNNPEASLTLFGSQHGPGEPAWRWATEHGLTRGVTFAGAVPPRQLGAWLAESPHCLVHVSRWEACSMALLEAQAIGIPIIGGSNSGGVAFTLGYGSAGLLVDITSSVAVASAMQRVVDEPGLRERLQERGIRLSRSQFALERVASAYLEELEKCTASS
jgi:glycosyltransferase involved in cell wall biosynthesis